MFPTPPARSQYSVLIRASPRGRVRIRVTELVEPVLVLEPFLVPRVDLSSLAAAAASEQAIKQQAASGKQHHARNGKKSELRRGALVLVGILVHDTYGCEVQSHKVLARNSTAAAGNGIRKWRTSVSKAAV